MINDIRLYINDKLVDFSGEINIPFIYQLEDIKNPTAIKNTFSKTITIVGTKNNNAIFGEIYNFDREQLYGDYLTGVYFNPSYRTPFTLFKNGELIESGYMQLNDISIKNKIINYNITLYGGLGDFFYSLSYNQENEPLQLKDLDYNTDLTFNISKDVINDCWNGTNELSKIIQFVPTYNGLYEDFDNDKVLIQTYNSNVFKQNLINKDGVNYTTYRGYAMGEMNKELTEWEMRSLMSFKQRPALKFSKFMESCCNPKNNGGYTVELDSEFFNNRNPYYDKTYIALPLLSETVKREGDSISDNVKVNSNKTIGYTNNIDTNYTPITVVGSSITMTDGVINTNGMGISTNFSIDLDVQLYFKALDNNFKADLFSCATRGYNDNYLSSILLQIEVVDVDNDVVIGRSNYYNFTYDKISNQDKWKNWVNVHNTPIETILGYYRYSEELKKHYFRSYEGNNTFRLKIENVYKATNMKFNLKFQYVSNRDNGLVLYKRINLDIVTERGNWNCIADSNTSMMRINEGKQLPSSGMKITQDMLLRTEKTPFDYLVGYCKMFNLYFHKSITEKKIVISQRKNYFKGDIININDKIDWSKEVKIKPLLYDKKFYKLALESNDSYCSEKYKNEYGVEYGQKRINTNYNFNNETVNMLDGNVYQNTVQLLDSSIYYRTFYNNNNIEQPPFIVDGLTYKLFDSNFNSTDIEMYGADSINLKKTVEWNKVAGSDIFDKLCCFSKDETKALADIENTLLFYNGDKELVNVNGEQVNYWLVDDVIEMYELNGGVCHLYTETEFDIANNRIAYKRTSIPQYSRYYIEDNKVTNSWDFGKPKEVYVPNINYNETVTIYNKYWDSAYKDKLSINTKSVQCFVNFMGITVNEELLRNFYYFSGSYWLLNKIENYDINSTQSVKCEFIKINDLNSYLS